MSRPKSTDTILLMPPRLTDEGHARQRLTLQVAFVGFLAVIHFFLIASFLNGSMHSTAVIKITYTREAVRSAAQETSNILLQAIADVNRLRRAGNFAHNTEAEKQLRAFFEAEASKDSGVDPTLVCKAAAEKAYNEHQQPRDRDTVLAEPLATPTGASVILSTYFGGRIDPTHCWHYPGGRLPSNAFPVLKPWYEAVERLGLSAVVFHDDDALGSEYAAGSQTGQVLFQRVQLGRPGWSLGDERWEVYLKWMQSPAAANVRWVLHVDPLEAVLAHDPFTLIQGQMAQYQLWTHVQHATRHDATRFARCFRNLPGSERWSVDEGGEILDTSAVGGTKQVMIDLARSMVLDLEGMYYESKTDAWHCQAAVMSRLLALADGPLGGVRTFKGGYPFCGEMADCVHDGVCDHALYANQA